jgi:DNA polymerase III alpha subunit
MDGETMTEELSLKSLDARLKKLEEIVFRREEIKQAYHPEPAVTTVSTLKDGDKDIILKATIAKVDAEVQNKPESEKKWRLQIITIGDYTGQIGLQLWDDMIDEYNHLKQNDAIIVRGGYVKEYKQNLQLRIAKGGKIEKQERHIL